MSDRLERPRGGPAPTDDMRQLAIAGVTRRVPAEGRDVVLAALGLIEPLPRDADGRQLCETCGGPLPDPIVNGGHKPCRRKACREVAS
jgi:hypothetical protein